MKTIDSTTTSLTFKIKDAGPGAPTLALRRIGSAVDIMLPIIARVGQNFTYRVGSADLKPGRYYANFKAGGCCCLTEEIYVDRSCKLLATSINAANNCGNC